MEHIGQRIKDLRKKANLTQDRLADYLGVSAQAVSKWELGQTAPDLSLIAPLCRVLGVTADELLGIGQEKEDGREAQLLKETDRSKNLALDSRTYYDKCLRAVEEFPRNMTLQACLAAAEASLALECRTPEKEELFKAAERRYRFILDEVRDEGLRRYVINCFVHFLVNQNRQEEAVPFAKQSSDADFLLLICLKGEERRFHWQRYTQGRLFQFVTALGMAKDSLPAAELTEKVIRDAIPDGNYLALLPPLWDSLEKQAWFLTDAGRYDEAMDKLREYGRLVGDYEVLRQEGEPLPYTCPLFDLLTCSRPILYSSMSMRELAANNLYNARFNPLRERADFKDLCAQLGQKEGTPYELVTPW